MIDTDQIAQMSREEKLKVMEAIWTDLSLTDTDVKSPAWHEDVLNETNARLAAGQEHVMDWDEAKQKLRKRVD